MYRIRAPDGNCATVRWEGPLKDSKGNESQWLGVEWDNPERGKHNGEYKGQQLFTVTVPNSGSFVREATIAKGLNLSDMLSEYRGANGFLSLDNTNLEKVGNIEATRENFPSHVRTVNCSHTLVGSYQFIWDLLKAAPIIQTLILGQDHFISIDPIPTQENSNELITYNLKEIVLNHTNLTDENIKIFFKAFPHLEKIDVSFISPPPSLPIFSSVATLKEIHLNGLKIANFNDLSQAIGKLPNLEILSISNNEISTIDPNAITKDQTFPSLNTLIMKSNKIDDIFALNGLMNLSKLEDLSLQRNPFQEKIGEIEARMIVVVRFPFLLKLNGSQISPSERYQSEIQYLEFYAKDVASNGTAKHQRWDELVKKFGEPAMPVTQTAPQSKQKRKAAIKLVFKDRIIEKVLPLSMQVGTLQSRILQLFKVDLPEVDLAIENGNYKGYLTFPSQTLAEVGCVDGTIIYAAPKGEMIIDETQQATGVKLRSMTELIETNDM